MRPRRGIPPDEPGDEGDPECAAGQMEDAPIPDSEPAVRTFWESNHRAFVRFATRLTGGDIYLAEDLVGSVIADILQKNRWDRLRNPKAYVYAALRKADFERKRRAVAEDKLTSEIGRLARDRSDGDLNLWAGQEWVDQQLAKLPLTRRAVMRRYVEEFTATEIGEQLGKKPDNIRQHIRHARNQLKKQLAQDPDVEPGRRQRHDEP